MSIFERTKKIIYYLIYNFIIVGTLAVGYFFNEQKVCGIIIGILFAYLLTFEFFGAALINNISIRKALRKKVISDIFIRVFEAVFDLFFIFTSLYFGYKKIFVCEIIEYILWMYIYYNLFIVYKKD